LILKDIHFGFYSNKFNRSSSMYAPVVLFNSLLDV